MASIFLSLGYQSDLAEPGFGDPTGLGDPTGHPVEGNKNYCVFINIYIHSSAHMQLLEP